MPSDYWCRECWRENARDVDRGKHVERDGWWPVKCWSAMAGVGCLAPGGIANAWLLNLTYCLRDGAALCAAFEMGRQSRASVPIIT